MKFPSFPACQRGLEVVDCDFGAWLKLVLGVDGLVYLNMKVIWLPLHLCVLAV